MTLNVLSLFAGIGGLELGLERAGMTTVGQVEIDPWCRQVLAKHWPEVPKHDDVRTAGDWWDSVPRPPVHVVAGGFPCQPFSLGGHLRGVADERWGWPWMASLVRAVGPRYVVVENVAALVRDGAAFGWVLSDLAEMGFDAEWTVYRASDFGAPHSRERLYLVAYTSSVDGESRDLLGSSGERAASLAARGLPRPSIHQRGELARQWLAREPRVDRLADGIPAQVERLHGDGNAVVPQVAEHVGRLIVAHAEQVAA